MYDSRDVMRCLIFSLLLATCYSGGFRGYDSCNSAETCSDCISLDPECTWCSDLGIDNRRRCMTRRFGVEGCVALSDPVDRLKVTSDIEFNAKDKDDNTVQIKPQAFSANVRNGSSIKFNVTIKPADNFPLDLYFVMDHSHSMLKTLNILKKNVGLMSDKLQELTNDFRIGFGTFVDKTTAPYIYTTVKKTANPCDPGSCPPAYNFNNTVSLNEFEKFADLIESSKVSASVDLPEAGMDALMQVAACIDEIGWRKHSRKIIVYLTDTGFHFAGDGKLGGQIERNDGQCWLLDGRTYAKEKELDYPSIHQVVKKMVDNNMIPIFGVTKNVENLYKDLAGLFPYGAMGILDENSENLVDLIVSNYKNISSKIEPRVTDAPDGVKTSWRAFCPGQTEVATECSDVGISTTAKFEFTIDTSACLASTEKLSIEFAGFGTISVDMDTLCNCNCTSEMEGSTAPCGGNGNYTCGVCHCLPSFFGPNCACSGSDAGSDLTCRAANTTTVCSAAGDCECGQCRCQGQQYGDYCECDDNNCPRGDNGAVCSGNGECACNVGDTRGVGCVCAEGWEGEACGCTTLKTDCMFNTKECDGQGDCVCGKCQCKKEEGSSGNDYTGKYCQLCPFCDKCAQFKECVICIAGTNEQAPRESSECSSCDIAYQVIITDKEPPEDGSGDKWCLYEQDECQYHAYSEPGPDDQTRQLLYINLDIDCHTTVAILWIIIGVVVAVVLFGMGILACWKCITTWKDKQEYKRFIDEMNMTKFASTQSPLYECPITTVNNPIARKM